MNSQFVSGILKQIGAAGYEKSVARSLRYNGHSEFRSSRNIIIEKRKDGRQGIDIHINARCKRRDCLHSGDCFRIRP